MERDANYTLVGLVSVILLVGLVAFVVWLGRLQFNQENQVYDIVFVGSVSGLTEGGEVQFNGIKVGEVTKLSIDRTDPSRVIARARVEADVPIRTDSYATLEPLGITGVNFVQVNAGTPSNPLLRDVTPPDKIPVIQTHTSVLSDLLEGGGTVLARAVEALDQVSAVLSDQNIANFSGVLEDLSIVTAAARDNAEVFANANEAIVSLNQAAKDISALSESTKSLIDNQGASALTNASDAAKELKTAAEEIRATVAELHGPTTDFATNTLPQVQSAISSLQSTADSLDRLVNEIEENPQGLITKAPSREIEVRP